MSGLESRATPPFRSVLTPFGPLFRLTELDQRVEKGVRPPRKRANPWQAKESGLFFNTRSTRRAACGGAALMTTETSMDVSVLEKLGDSFNALSEGVSQFLTRLFGSSNERHIRKLGYIRSKDPDVPPTIIAGSLLAQVNALEEKMHALSPEELKALTPQFRQRLANGAT